MKKFLILTTILTAWIQCIAQERTSNIPTNCNSFKTCYERSTKTDVYRNKIRYLDGALHYWKSRDGKNVRAGALVERAEYRIREAGGDTGYKGSEIVKVTHKKDYKESAYKSAISDLNEALKDPKSLGNQKEAASQLLDEATGLLDRLE